MSLTNLTIGGTFLVALGTLAIRTVMPVPVMVINALAFDTRAELVTQDRTVSTRQPAVQLIWTATVEDMDGNSLQMCEGSGANGYVPGRRSVTFSLPIWTGNPACTYAALPPGTYRLRGTWRGGEVSVGALSEPFSKPNDEVTQ